MDERFEESSNVTPDRTNDPGVFSLESFREELDNITKSLDDEVNFDQLLQEARRMSRSHEDEQRSPAHSVEDGYQHSMSVSATPEPTPVKTPRYQRFDYDENGDFLSPVEENDDDDVSDDDLALIDRLDRQAVQIRRLQQENRSLREEVHQLRDVRQSNPLKSPGTAFVDELRHVVDLPGDQYANLSRIMDIYLDQEKSQRKVRRSRFY